MKMDPKQTSRYTIVIALVLVVLIILAWYLFPSQKQDTASPTDQTNQPSQTNQKTFTGPPAGSVPGAGFQGPTSPPPGK